MMIKKIASALFFLLIFLLSTQDIFAEGGRFRIEDSNSPVSVERQSPVFGWAYLTASQDVPSSGEHIALRIVNPRSGDVCTTSSDTTNKDGEFFGSCTAITPGQLLVYVHSLDKHDDSNQFVIYFAQTIAIPTPVSNTSGNMSTIIPSPFHATTDSNTSSQAANIKPSSSITYKERGNQKKIFQAGITIQNGIILLGGILLIVLMTSFIIVALHKRDIAKELIDAEDTISNSKKPPFFDTPLQ